MTRATLLHVLDHPTAIGPAEVRELEQLAQAFPYCQTAHLLLAKAAHDQGTMLAGQRLRRAATYAADRELLRHLIEQVPEAHPSAEVSQLEIAAPAPGPAPAIAEQAPAAAPEEAQIQTAVTAIENAAPAPSAAAAPVLETTPLEAGPGAVETAPVAIAEAVTAPAAELPPTPVVPAIFESAPAADAALAPVVEAAIEASASDTGSDLPIIAPLELASAESSVSEAVIVDEIAGLASAEQELQVPEAEELSTMLAEAEPVDEVPATAPPVRPPAEAVAAQQEFGLVETPAPAPAYELPGLVDEWAAAATTLALGAPIAELLAPTAPSPAWTEAAFSGDDFIGYAMSGGSRFGFAMQLLLTDDAAEAPASSLPPAGAFFEPDVLLAAHWEAHRPVVPPAPSPLDLINTFLKRQPRLTRPAMLPPTAEAQTDLSVRSTRAESDLASESLARILARQGKTERAVEIYRRLMEKQPEKAAYFANQIQQLQPPA